MAEVVDDLAENAVRDKEAARRDFAAVKASWDCADRVHKQVSG